jgi:hypothetical protein
MHPLHPYMAESIAAERTEHLRNTAARWRLVKAASQLDSSPSGVGHVVDLREARPDSSESIDDGEEACAGG